MSTFNAETTVKRMRKGTRACQECRRRKIKCTYVNEASTNCRECSENGRVCTSQGISVVPRASGGVDKSNRLKIRVTRLESVVERLSRTLPQPLATPPPFGIQAQLWQPNINTRDITDRLEHEVESIPPLYALFRNEILSTDDDLSLPTPISHSVSFSPTQISDRERLLSTISKETEILSVLQISSSWWPPFQHHYSGLQNSNIKKSLPEFVSNNLANERPVCIALGLLCIATSLQTLRPGIDDQTLYLSGSCTEVMNKITATVDQVVLDNEEEIDCFEGMVLFLMRGKYYAESNQLRKAWLGIRRAILVAQKIDQCNRQPLDNVEGCWRKLTDSILETDRFLSMFLGMPFALDARFDDIQTEGQPPLGGDIDGRMRSLRRAAAHAAGRINNRNSGPEDLAFDQTRAIQHSLDNAVELMPIEWWDIGTHTTYPLNPLATFEHLSTQFWFFQTQCFLQLPYMLRAASNPEFMHNREICLNASRNLVKIWILLRQNAALSTYLCRLDDFQGLIAAIIILVGMMQCNSYGLVAGEDTLRGDMEILGNAKEVFRDAEKEQNGAIARQGLRVLDTLGSFLQSEDNEHEYDEEPSKKRKATLFVPYFGAIAVEAAPLYHSKQEFAKQPKDRDCLAPLSDELSMNGMSQNSFDFFNPEAGRDTQGLHIMSNDQAEVQNPIAFPLTDKAPATFSHIEEHPPDGYIENGDLYNQDAFDGLSHDFVSDWEKFMLGTELNQDWNERLVDFD